MEAVNLSDAPHLWTALEDQWRGQCDAYDENFGDYYEIALRARPQSETASPPLSINGEFALRDEEGVYLAVFFLNRTAQKGYTGPVLRVFDFMVCPRLDFDEWSAGYYARLIGHYLTAVVDVSLSTQMRSAHIKIHTKTPQEREMFTVLAEVLAKGGAFKDVAHKGLWLSISHS